MHLGGLPRLPGVAGPLHRPDPCTHRISSSSLLPFYVNPRKSYAHAQQAVLSGWVGSIDGGVSTVGCLVYHTVVCTAMYVSTELLFL